MNIALLGFGTVGKAFYELTLGRSDLRVTSVLSRRPRPELPCTVTNDFDEIVRDRSVGIVVEVMGGLEPAYRYICAAMRAGSSQTRIESFGPYTVASPTPGTRRSTGWMLA